MKLSIIIPAYNEEKCIKNTIKETLKSVSQFERNFEIVVIDDGSKDKTYEIARSIKDKRVRVFRKKNGGKGSAWKYGFKFARGEFITFIDADLDLHPRQIKKFLEIQKQTNADVVVGSKRHPESKLKYPLIRRILSTAYYLMNKILFGLPIKDTQSGLKLFKKEVLEKVFSKSLVKRYAADLEFLVNAHRLGYKIVEAPIELKFQRFSSRIKLKDIWYIFLDTLGIFYRMKKGYYDG